MSNDPHTFCEENTCAQFMVGKPECAAGCCRLVAPVAAAAGAVPAHRVADLLHMLQFATITTPTPGDAEQAVQVMAELRSMLTAAPPPPAAPAVAVDEAMLNRAEAGYRRGGGHHIMTTADRLPGRHRQALFSALTAALQPQQAGETGGGNGWISSKSRRLIGAPEDLDGLTGAEMCGGKAEHSESLTYDVRRWCSGDRAWTKWQPCTAAYAAANANDESLQFRPLKAAPKAGEAGGDA